MEHKYKRISLILLILIGSLLIGCIVKDNDSGIDGIVLIGPICPVVKEGEPCPDRPFAATIEIQKDGVLLATVQSGDDGKFHVNLTAGEYKLMPLSPNKGGIPHAESQFVKIESGKFTNVTINYDSGIR